MDRRFSETGDPLGRVIEECGELLAAAGKTVRYGWDSQNPLPGASKETNEAWLRREIWDLRDALDRLARERHWYMDPGDDSARGRTTEGGTTRSEP